MGLSDEHNTYLAVRSRLAADLAVEIPVGEKVTEDKLTAAAERFLQLGWADIPYISADLGKTLETDTDNS